MRWWQFSGTCAAFNPLSALRETPLGRQVSTFCQFPLKRPCSSKPCTDTDRGPHLQLPGGSARRPHPASRSRPPQCSALAPAPEVSVAVGNHLRTAPRWCTAAPATGAARGQRRRRRRRAAAAASLRSRSGPPLAPPSQLASRPYCCAREASRSQLSSRSLETFCSSPQASIPMPRYALQSGCMRRGLCAGGAPGSSR